MMLLLDGGTLTEIKFCGLDSGSLRLAVELALTFGILLLSALVLVKLTAFLVRLSGAAGPRRLRYSFDCDWFFVDAAYSMILELCLYLLALGSGNRGFLTTAIFFLLSLTCLLMKSWKDIRFEEAG